MAGKLNARQKRFCQEYIVDLCAMQAVIRAGYWSAASRSPVLRGALELLERHQGLLNDKLSVTHSGIDGLLESLAEVASSTPAGRAKAQMH